MALSFDLEQKITWDELAPSLQDRFKSIGDKIDELAKEIDVNRGASFKSWSLRMWENSHVFTDLSFYEFYDVVQSGVNNRITSKDKMNIWGNMTGPYYKDGHPGWVKHMEVWNDPATGEDKVVLGCGIPHSSIYLSDADGLEFKRVASFGDSHSIWDIAIFKGAIFVIGYPGYVVYRSTDGLTWRSVASFGANGKTLCVFNNMLMWVGPGVTYYSSDGVNWSSRSNNCPSYVYSRYYKSKSGYMYVGTANSYPGIYRSSDGFNFSSIWNGTSADSYMRWICSWTPNNSGNTEYIVWGTGGTGTEAGTARLMAHNTVTGQNMCLFDFRGDSGSNVSNALNYGHAPLEPLIATEINTTTSTSSSGVQTEVITDKNTGRTTTIVTDKVGSNDKVTITSIDPVSGFEFVREIDGNANTSNFKLQKPGIFSSERKINTVTNHNENIIIDSQSGSTIKFIVDPIAKTFTITATGKTANASLNTIINTDTGDITSTISQGASYIEEYVNILTGINSIGAKMTGSVSDGIFTTSTDPDGSTITNITNTKNDTTGTSIKDVTGKIINSNYSDGDNLSIAILSNLNNKLCNITISYNITIGDVTEVYETNIKISDLSIFTSTIDPETESQFDLNYNYSTSVTDAKMIPDIEISATGNGSHKLSGFRERQIRYIEVFTNDYTGESFLIIGTSDCHFYRELSSSKLVYSEHDWDTHSNRELKNDITNLPIVWSKEDKEAWMSDAVANSPGASYPTYMGNVYTVSPKYPNATFDPSKLVVTLIKHTEDTRVYSMCTFVDPNGVKWAYAGTGGGNYNGRGLLYRFGYTDMLNLIEGSKLGAVLPPKWSVERSGDSVNRRLLQKASRFYLKIMGGVSARDAYSEIRFAFAANPVASTSINPYIKLIFNHAGADNYYAAKFYPTLSKIDVIDVRGAVENVIQSISTGPIQIYATLDSEEAIESPKMGPYYILSALVYPGAVNPNATSSANAYLHDSLDGKIEIYLKVSKNRLDSVGKEDIISTFTIDYAGGERKHIGQYGIEMYDLPSIELISMKQMSYHKHKKDALEVGEIDFAVR